MAMRRSRRRLARRVMLLVFSLLLTVLGAFRLWDQRGRLEWVPVTAVISRFNDGRDWSTRRARWTPGVMALIRYKFDVANATYESDEVMLINHERKGPNSAIQIYFNPANPQESSLTKDLSIWDIVLTVLGAAGVIYNSVRLRKRLRNMGSISDAASGRRP